VLVRWPWTGLVYRNWDDPRKRLNSTAYQFWVPRSHFATLSFSLGQDLLHESGRRISTEKPNDSLPTPSAAVWKAALPPWALIADANWRNTFEPIDHHVLYCVCWRKYF
jgi:hypothetical protein